MAQSLSLSSSRAATASLFNPSQQYGGERRSRSAEGIGGREVRVIATATQPTIFGALLAYLKEASGVRNVIFKTIYTLSDWIFMYNPELTAVKKLSAANKDAKNFAALSEIPGKTVDLFEAGANFAARGNIGSFGNLVNKIGLWLHPSIDFFKVTSQTLSPLTAATMRTVETVANSALVFTTGYGTVEECMTIDAQQTMPLPSTRGILRDRIVAARDAQITQSWLKISMNISYFAIGFLGLAALATELTVAPWVILSLATSALVFTISSALQKKVDVEPAALNLLPFAPLDAYVDRAVRGAPAAPRAERPAREDREDRPARAGERSSRA